MGRRRRTIAESVSAGKSVRRSDGSCGGVADMVGRVKCERRTRKRRGEESGSRTAGQSPRVRHVRTLGCGGNRKGLSCLRAALDVDGGGGGAESESRPVRSVWANSPGYPEPPRTSALLLHQKHCCTLPTTLDRRGLSDPIATGTAGTALWDVWWKEGGRKRKSGEEEARRRKHTHRVMSLPSTDCGPNMRNQAVIVRSSSRPQGRSEGTSSISCRRPSCIFVADIGKTGSGIRK